jgi:hypothetical protein
MTRPADQLPDCIPCTRDEYRRLWTASRHLICTNTRGALDAILHPRSLDGSLAKAALFRAYPILAQTGLALIPRHIRHTCGLPTCARVDAVTIQSARAIVALLHRTDTYLTLLRQLCRHGHQVQTEAMRQRAGLDRKC